MVSSDRYKLIKLYDREDLELFYSKYIENIKGCPFPTIYLHPSHINIKPAKNRRWERIADRDGYIDKYKDDKVLLAKDILDRGNFFPIWVYKEDGKYYVSEGYHRIESIKIAAELGIWKDQKLFCIVIDKSFDINNTSRLRSERIEVLELNIPAYNIEDGWFVKKFGKHFIRFNNVESLKAIYKESEDPRDQPIKIKINTEEEYFRISKIYHKFLRHAFYKYETSTKQRLEGYFKPC